MAGNDYTTAAKILAIIAAVSFIITGVLALFVLATWSSAVGAYEGTIGPYGQSVAGMVTTWILIGAMLNIVAGVVVLVGGLKLSNPASRQTGSILVLVFGVIGLFGGGGFILTGTILAVVAGILGLVSK